MTHHPFDPEELGRVEADLARVAEHLERYADAATGTAPVDLVSRINSALDAEPAPRRPFAILPTAWRGPMTAFAAAAVLVAAILGAVAIGQFVEDARNRIGTSPSPAVPVTPSPTPSPTPTSTPSPSPSPSATPSASPTESVTPTDSPSAEPTETDGGTETPEPSATDDSSGPGGGNSGPGGGGSGGDSSGSGSGSGNSGSGSDDSGSGD